MDGSVWHYTGTWSLSESVNWNGFVCFSCGCRKRQTTDNGHFDCGELLLLLLLPVASRLMTSPAGAHDVTSLPLSSIRGAARLSLLSSCWAAPRLNSCVYFTSWALLLCRCTSIQAGRHVCHVIREIHPVRHRLKRFSRWLLVGLKLSSTVVETYRNARVSLLFCWFSTFYVSLVDKTFNWSTYVPMVDVI